MKTTIGYVGLALIGVLLMSQSIIWWHAFWRNPGTVGVVSVVLVGFFGLVLWDARRRAD